MNLNITQESICNSISTQWKVANDFSNTDDWNMTHHTFRSVRDQLDGMWELLNWSKARSKSAQKELKEDLTLLRRIAEIRSQA